jgi:hypothetical protein
MNYKFLTLAGSVLLGSTLLSTTSAMACTCTAAIAEARRAVISEGNETQSEIRSLQDDVKDASEENNDRHQELKDHLDVKVAELIEALKGQSRENSNYQQMQVEAAQRIEDAAQVNHTQRLRDEFRATAESGINDPNPYSCMILDLFGGSGSGAGTDSNGTEVVSAASDFLIGDSPEVAEGGTVLAKKIKEDRDAYQTFHEVQNATSDWGILLREPTIDLDDDEMNGFAQLMVRNLINTAPEKKVTEAEELTPAGLARIAQQEERNSRIGAAMESIAMQLNMRSAVMTDDTAVKQYKQMAEDSAYNREYEGLEKLSELQQIDIMTVWNYAPKGERAEVLTNGAELSEKAWMSELHRIMSLNARINYLNLELASRDAVVNAAILATLNDDS